MTRKPLNHSVSPRRFGAGMIIAAWLLVLGLLTAYFSGWLDRQHNPNQYVVGTTLDDGANEVVLKQNRHGHYVANGSINEHSVRFMLDTGATAVSVPAGLARHLDLKAGAPQHVQTANGVITTYTTRLDRVDLGSIVLHDIPAHINPRMKGNEVLLGMSFLRNLEFTQRDGTLTIHQDPPS